MEHIESLNLEGDTPYEIIVRPYKSSRSIEQNNLLHSWLRVIAEETGHTVEEIKDYVCSEYLGSSEYLGINGTPKRRLVTTSELSVEEMSALIERWVTEQSSCPHRKSMKMISKGSRLRFNSGNSKRKKKC